MAFRSDSRSGGPSRDRRAFRDERPSSDRRRTPQRGTRPDGDGRPPREFRRDGDRSFRRDGERSFARDGERSSRRDGERSFARGGDRTFKGEGDRSFRRGGDRPFKRDGERFGDRDQSRRPSGDRYRDRGRSGTARPERQERGRFSAGGRSGADGRHGAPRSGSFSSRQEGRRRSGDERRQPPILRSQRPVEAEAAAATPPPDDLIWGRHATQAALESGRPIHRIWCTPEMRSASKFLQLLRDAKASGVLVEEVTWARLGQLTGGSVHQGIALQTAAADTLNLETLIDGCADLGEPPLLLALDGVTDPHNLGAVVRSAEAMGAHGVVLPQRRSAGLTGSVAKVAAGALEHMPVARVVNLNRSLEKLKDSGYRVIGLAAEGDTTLVDADLEGPLVLVTGSEGQGLSLLTKRHCDQLVRIPLRGITPSLNASVATALCVYEVARRSWMKDIHGQAPSPPVSRPRIASAEPAGDAQDATVAALADPQKTQSESPAETIELELQPSDGPDMIQFDQSIQLST